MQIRLNKFLVVLLAVVLLGAIGCVPPDTSQNNAAPNSNQNTPNQNTPGNTTPIKPIVCNGVTEKEIKDEINQLPPTLKNQFREVNPATGTISLSYANGELVFKGFFTSDGKDLRLFFNQFDRFRGGQCVKYVYFQGDKADTFFEWRPSAGFTPPPPSTCKANVEKTLDNSSFSSQMKKYLDYMYDDKTGDLNLIGSFSDIPGSPGQLNRFISDLQRLTADGCISKIVFKGKPDEKLLNVKGFGWSLCEPPLVECAGECVSSCPGNGNNNSIINNNTNTGANTNNNINNNTNR